MMRSTWTDAGFCITLCLQRGDTKTILVLLAICTAFAQMPKTTNSSRNFCVSPRSKNGVTQMSPPPSLCAQEDTILLTPSGNLFPSEFLIRWRAELSRKAYDQKVKGEILRFSTKQLLPLKDMRLKLMARATWFHDFSSRLCFGTTELTRVD